MRYLADRESAKQLDAYAQQMGMNGLVLMERAALKLAFRIKTIMDSNPSYTEVLCICGVGNNGGDGLAAVRMLFEWGYFARAVVIGEETSFSEPLKLQWKLAKNSGVSVSCEAYEEVVKLVESFRSGILIDAIFGVGLSREIEGGYLSVIRAINCCKAYKVAVDIPSGINADDGSVLKSAVKADMTVTFGVNKIGLLVYPGKSYAGDVFVEDIGFPRKALQNIVFPAFTFDSSEAEQLLPVRKEYSHKGSFGKVLIIAGSFGMSGAAFLSALAAYRNGAGLVKIFTSESNRIILQSLLPEAIMETYLEEEDCILNEETLERLSYNLEHWADVIVVGSGIGKSNRSRSMLEEVLKQHNLPIIIDADGIELYRDYMKKKDGVFKLQEMRENIILTPHIKELASLLEVELLDVKDNLVKVAETFREAKAVLVLKEAKTIISGKGQIYVNSTGNSAMAKAGSGDVLTGFIAAHLALGSNPFIAACLGVYFHGLKGDCEKIKSGAHSVLARDLA